MLNMELCWSLNVLVPCLRMPQTPDIFSLADAAWKHPKYPCICILPPEFGVNIYIHKHENSEVLCSTRNKTPYEMSGNSRLLIHGKHLNEIWLYESDPNAPSTCSEPGGKQWQRSIRGRRNWDVELGPCAVIRHLRSVAFVRETKRPQADSHHLKIVLVLEIKSVISGICHFDWVKRDLLFRIVKWRWTFVKLLYISFHCNSIPGYGITIHFYICFSSISVVPYANLCGKSTKLDRPTGLVLC